MPVDACLIAFLDCAPGGDNYLQIGGKEFCECFQWVTGKIERVRLAVQGEAAISTTVNFGRMLGRARGGRGGSAVLFDPLVDSLQNA
ncbi:MAG: hypothetical protein ACLQG3_14255 [Terracidiphilus sp.]